MLNLELTLLFSASWLSCCLLPSLHVLVEQQPLGPDGARRILFHHAGNSSLMFELVKGGLVTTFSQLFFSSELCRCMSRCSNLRDHLNGTVPTKRGHMRTGRWCLLTPGHLAALFCSPLSIASQSQGQMALNVLKSPIS